MAYSPESIVAVSVCLPLVAVVAVYLRFLVRLKIQPTYLGIDDWLILFAVLFSLCDGANLALAAILGIQGRDFPGQIPQDRENLENKSDFAQVILEKPMYGLMKLSVLFFYRRIFTVQKRFRTFNTCVICLVTAWTLAYLLVEIFECGIDPSVLWTPGASTAACVNRTWMNFSFAITDVVGDLLVVLMPFPIIRKLHMDQRQKIGVAAIFMLGLLSTAAAIVRLGFISLAFTQNYGAFGVNTHEAGTPPAVWSTVEGAVGVTAACLPPLGPLIRRAPQAGKAPVNFYTRHIKRSTKGQSPNASAAIDTERQPSWQNEKNYRQSAETDNSPTRKAIVQRPTEWV